jgi:hypothetical protein
MCCHKALRASWWKTSDPGGALVSYCFSVLVSFSVRAGLRARVPCIFLMPRRTFKNFQIHRHGHGSPSLPPWHMTKAHQLHQSIPASWVVLSLQCPCQQTSNLRLSIAQPPPPPFWKHEPCISLPEGMDQIACNPYLADCATQRATYQNEACLHSISAFSYY